MPNTPKNWFVTGASSGFGESLAELLLAKGDKVAATFRHQTQADEFTQKTGGNGKGIVLDVTDAARVPGAVQEAIDALGHLDVVVNNAGYGSLGPIEEIDEAEVQRQFDVNVFGPLRVLRAVLPHLRERKSGHILNVTSIGGLRAFPGVGIYNGSKFALEGIGEALSKEVGPLGIRVTNIEPSGFRTKWAGESATFTKPKNEDYNATAGKNMGDIQGYSGNQPGDPVRAAQAMYDVVQLEHPPLHLPLGVAAVKGARAKIKELSDEVEQYAHVGEGADFPAAK